MVLANQTEIRTNFKKYLDIAATEEPVIVPRKGGLNVVILSEKEYSKLSDISMKYDAQNN